MRASHRFHIFCNLWEIFIIKREKLIWKEIWENINYLKGRNFCGKSFCRIYFWNFGPKLWSQILQKLLKLAELQKIFPGFFFPPHFLSVLPLRLNSCTTRTKKRKIKSWFCHTKGSKTALEDMDIKLKLLLFMEAYNQITSEYGRKVVMNGRKQKASPKQYAKVWLI